MRPRTETTRKGDCDLIADCTDRKPVRLRGTLKTVTLRPRGGVPALEAELFDEIDEVGVRDGANLEVAGYDFAPSFSIWTTIEECLNPPVVYEADPAMLSFLTSAGWELDGVSRALDMDDLLVPQVRLHTDLSVVQQRTESDGETGPLPD